MTKDHFLNKLASKFPKNLIKYDYSNIPSEFKSGENKVSIKCKIHGEFEQLASCHLFGQGCPSCGKTKSSESKITNYDFIGESKAIFGDSFQYDLTVYTGMHEPVILTCKEHGVFSIPANLHLGTKYGCPDCSSEKYLQSRKSAFIEKATAVHKGLYTYDNIEFISVNERSFITCKKHGDFLQKLASHLKGAGCQMCASENNRGNSETFIQKAKEIHGNRYDYSKSIYTKGSDHLKITCHKHGDFTQRASSHLQGNGCRDCQIELGRSTTEDFIRSAKEIHGDRYDYSKSIYTGNKEKLTITCKQHGDFELRPNSHLSSRQGCLRCHESKGETAVSRILDKLGIRYIREYRIEDSLYRFDFYIPGSDVFIEYHGQQHFAPVEVFGGLDGFLSTKRRDEAKVLLVQRSGGRLGVIKYTALQSKNLESTVKAVLRGCRRYWINANGQLKVFDKPSELYAYYGINRTIKLRDLFSEIERSNPGVTFIIS